MQRGVVPPSHAEGGEGGAPALLTSVGGSLGTPREGHRFPDMVVASRTRLTSLLRGDWEPPETLLIAFDESWRQGLTSLVIRAKSETEVVAVLTPEQDHESPAREWVKWMGIESIVMPHDSPWIRDYGPFEMVAKNGDRRWVDMVYNPDRPHDDGVPLRLGELVGMPVEKRAFWLDGGGLISNGAGLCAMTEVSFEILVNGEVPELVRNTIARLGCEVLAITPEVMGEQTGHIDVVAQFLAPNIVAVAEIDSLMLPAEAMAMDETVERLLQSARELHQSLEIVRVPMPANGEIYYSYINGLRLQRSFMLPHYANVDDSVERLAYSRLREGIPVDVDLVPVDADSMAARGGAVHCITLGLGNAVDRLGQGPSHQRLRRLVARNSQVPLGTQPSAAMSIQ